MDVHRNLKGVTAEALREAHLKDLQVQAGSKVRYHKYFFNEQTGTVFCLAEGPSAEACRAVHSESHGLLPDDIIEVQPELVEAFFEMTRYDDVGAAVTSAGEPDGALRVIMFTEIANFTQVAREHEGQAVRLVECHDHVVREVLEECHGHEVRHTGEGIMACFISVSAAVRAATEIQRRCRMQSESEATAGHEPVLRIGISAGEPVEQHRELFGAAVNTARRICEAADPGQILVSAALRELGVGKGARFYMAGERALKGVEERQILYGLEWETDAAPRPGTEPPLSRAVHALGDVWGELLRRRVVKVVAGYGIVLFGILQAAELTLEPLGLPAWSYTLVLTLGLLGFPLTVVLAWALDITPTGLERTSTAVARGRQQG